MMNEKLFQNERISWWRQSNSYYELIRQAQSSTGGRHQQLSFILSTKYEQTLDIEHTKAALAQ